MPLTAGRRRLGKRYVGECRVEDYRWGVRVVVAAVYELAGGNIYFLCVYCLYVALAAIHNRMYGSTHITRRRFCMSV